MRDNKGRFIKGVHYSPSTEFRKGEHWRKPQIFRDNNYLYHHYIELNESSKDIANENNCSVQAIIYWLNKHNIARRDTSQVRKIKHWGASGINNPMYGRKGPLNPCWKGGATPERQDFYVTDEWKEAVKIVWQRDRGMCQKCWLKGNGKNKFHIHHIVSFACKRLRCVPDNLVLLCVKCHRFVHSKRNINKDFIKVIGKRKPNNHKSIISHCIDDAQLSFAL